MKSETFDIIWNAIESYCNQFILDSGHTFYLNNKAKTELLSEYHRLNDNFKKKYMEDAEGARPDRHKEAAILMIAILNVNPIGVPADVQVARRNSAVYTGYDSKFFGNEKLAILTGLAILREYIYKDMIKNNPTIAKTQIKLIPKNVKHGSYIENYCRELYINTIERELSILSLAHELFLLEKLYETHGKKHI